MDTPASILLATKVGGLGVVGAGRVRSLLSALDKEGILLDNHEMVGALIEWHVSIDELEKSIHIYDVMRRLNLSPSLSCYLTFLNNLVNKSQTQLLFGVYSDLLEITM